MRPIALQRTLDNLSVDRGTNKEGRESARLRPNASFRRRVRRVTYRRRNMLTRAAGLGKRGTPSAFGVPKGRAAPEWVSGSNRGHNACPRLLPDTIPGPPGL